MKQKLMALAAVAATASLGSGAAGATATTGGTLSDFTITLYDLNPLDSITPSITFNNASGSYVYSFAVSQTPYSYDAEFGSGGTPLGTASAVATGALSSASAVITAGGNAATSASASPGDSTYANGVAYLGNDGSLLGFTLSADTLLVISATSSLWASTTLYSEYTGSAATLQLWGNGPNSNQSASSSFLAVAGGIEGYADTATSGGDMAVSFVNGSRTSSASGNFYGYLTSWAQNYTPASTVPEPGNLALLAAGLGALGLLSRRRARQG